MGSRAALDIFEKEKSLAATEIQTLDCFVHSTVTIQTLPSQPLSLQVIHMAISKKCLLKWTTFHLKLYASSVLDELIQFVQGVTTEWSPASSKPNTWMVVHKEFKT